MGQVGGWRFCHAADPGSLCARPPFWNRKGQADACPGMEWKEVKKTMTHIMSTSTSGTEAKSLYYLLQRAGLGAVELSVSSG